MKYGMHGLNFEVREHSAASAAVDKSEARRSMDEKCGSVPCASQQKAWHTLLYA